MSSGHGRRRSLRRTVDLLVGISALVVVVAVVGAFVAAANLSRARTRLADRYDPALFASAQLLAALVDQETGVRGYVLSGDPAFLEPWTSGQRSEQAVVGELRATLAGEADQLAALDSVETAAATWRDQAGTPFAEAQPGSVDDEQQAAGKRLFDDVRARQATFDELLRSARASARADLDRAAAWLRFWLIALASLMLAVLAALYVALRRVVLRPLSSLVAQVRLVAGGQLERRIVVDGPSELAELGSATDAMREQIVGQLHLADEKGAELTRSNRDLEQFAYVASHDLQEPLRKVAAFCQLLRDRYGGQLDERADQYIDFAVDGAKRMQVLINDLLTFSRVGRSGESAGPVELDDAVGRAVANLELAIDAAGADVRVGHLPVVVGERTLLVALFQNLIANALKFRDPARPPVVTIAASKDADGLDEITVEDNGIGIEAQYRERVFVVFQRLHTREQYEGTGIGLALCRKIVELHGGRITIEDPPAGVGTLFRLTFGTGPATAPTTVSTTTTSSTNASTTERPAPR